MEIWTAHEVRNYIHQDSWILILSSEEISDNEQDTDETFVELERNENSVDEEEEKARNEELEKK